MSVRSIAAVGTAVLALFVTGQALADTEDTTAPDTMAEQPQTRGAYVARAAGCRACHSGEAGDYAGGKVIETPFGNLASANITPDPETGIGGWTLADFDRALRQGHNREGEPLYPAMPYMHYTKMTDEDLGLLWDYIQSLEPVRNEVDVNRLPFPYSIRASVNVWQGLYFEEGRFEPDPEESDTWNRGAYLVQAMAHCGSCHTPRDALGGPKKDQFLQGRQLGSYYAPDISGGPGSVIGDRSVEELTAFLHGNGENNHVALSDMRQVTSDLSSLREDDVRAIATYIKSLGDSEAPVEQTVAEIDSGVDGTGRKRVRDPLQDLPSGGWDGARRRCFLPGERGRSGGRVAQQHHRDTSAGDRPRHRTLCGIRRDAQLPRGPVRSGDRGRDQLCPAELG